MPVVKPKSLPGIFLKIQEFSSQNEISCSMRESDAFAKLSVPAVSRGGSDKDINLDWLWLWNGI